MTMKKEKIEIGIYIIPVVLRCSVMKYSVQTTLFRWGCQYFYPTIKGEVIDINLNITIKHYYPRGSKNALLPKQINRID